MKKIILALLIFSINHLLAQSYDTIQKHSMLLTNATIHIGNGTVYENGVIAFEKGKITLVGDATTMRYDATKYSEIINCAGKHIYPGLIALNSQLGLIEIEQARSTRDTYETGEINPSVRSIISYNTDSKVIPTIRTNGILIAQIIPSGGLISGSSSVVELDAWNWEDAAYKSDNGMQITWPGYYTYSFENGYFQIIPNKNYTAEIQKLETFFDEARAYCNAKNHANTNLKFEAMRNVFEKQSTLFIQANTAKEIIAAVQFAEKNTVSYVIVGASQAGKILDFLQEHHVKIILENLHSLPGLDDADIKTFYKLPAQLQQAGVEYALSYSFSHWNMRNLPFLAGTAAAYGISKEQALESITLSAAKMLGIENTLGSLESGKDATLLICEGDLLDMKSSVVERAFIRGREIEINNWQYENYEKFSKKYGLEIK